MRYLLLLIALVMFVFPPQAVAQDEIVCEPDWQAIRDLLDEAEAAVDENDFEGAVAAMSEANSLIALAESDCLGLSFSGDSETVVGPQYIPEGVYRVKVATDGFFIMEATVLEGECEGSSFGALFNLFSTDTAGGETDRVSEAIFTSEGCEVLWEISNVLMGGYEVTFEKVR